MKSISRFLALAFAVVALMLAAFAPTAYASGYHAGTSLMVGHSADSPPLSTVPATAGTSSTVSNNYCMNHLIDDLGAGNSAGGLHVISAAAVADWRSSGYYQLK